LTPPIDDSKVSETVRAADLFARAADWDLEQDYEQRSRSKKTKESTRLPIKTAEGTVKQFQAQRADEDVDSDSFLGSGTEDEDEAAQQSTPPTDPEPQIPVKQQVLSAKEEIARLVTLLNEDPEEHSSSFKKLAELCTPASPVAVQKLVLAAQAAVYKDNIPGYRIRSYKDEELGSKISKDVRKTRQYEHALVTGYHSYVKQLGSLTKNRKGNAEHRSLRSVAINCACALLLSVPHFNFRTELLNILAYELCSREATAEFNKCVDTVEKFFANDEDGAPSLEAVSLLTKMVKAKDYRIREEVLNTFFQLRLLSELPPPGWTDKDQGTDSASKIHGRKIKKEKSQHITKKERKLRKERRAVEKDMAEASALVNHEEREKLQSETLKLVFVTYFRILKQRVPELMGAVLEGLARYAHLINQDLFGDLLEALKEIVAQADDRQSSLSHDLNHLTHEESEAADTAAGARDSATMRNLTRESLLATQTAFTLLSGQDASRAASTLNLDLSFFTSHTYRSIYPLSLDADIELGPKSLRLPDPHSASTSPGSGSGSSGSGSGNGSVNNGSERITKVNISTPILLLTRVLTSILLTPSAPPPTLTALAFFKRLLTVSLQLPEKSCLAVLALLHKIADKHARKIEPLWYSDERRGDGVFQGSSDSVEGTNVLSVGTGVWEMEIMKRHFCPAVREAVGKVEAVVRDMHR
jgi:nucleolar complex protein 3